MGLLGKLIKTGIVAGAAVAAVKVSEKYTANNPEGINDPQARTDAIKQAATEVYQDAMAAAAQKAPNLTNAVNDIANGKAPDIANTVVNMAKEKAPEILNMAKEKAPDLASKVQSAASTVATKAQQFADSLDDGVVDADIVDFEDKNEEK